MMAEESGTGEATTKTLHFDGHQQTNKSTTPGGVLSLSSSSSSLALRGAGGGGTLSRKLQKVLELNTEEADLQAALQHVSGWYGPPHHPNSKHARRLLRSNLERQSLLANQHFLHAFSLVQQSLEEVEADVGQMKASCLLMADRLAKTRAVAGKLILTADKFQHDKKENELKQEVITAFLERFRLTEAEQVTLRSGDINKDFFQALKHVGQIYSECPVLLRTHQKAGFEVMEAMSMEQQSAYDRLYRWVKDQFASLKDDPSDINEYLITAVSTLQEKQPVLLSYCFDEIVHTRSQILLATFHAALTVGGPGGTPRPIEMHAHDPQRFVGDMLAWLHQAVASEYELLQRVFSPDADNQAMTALSPTFSEDAPSESYLSRLPSHKQSMNQNLARVLSRIFEPLMQPFKIRVDQVLDPQTKPSTVEVYRINNMLDFYSRMISRIMGKQASLPSLFNGCKEEVLKLFYDILKSNADNLLSHAPAVPSDLGPPHCVHESMTRLMEVMATFDESLVPAEERVAEFAPVLSAVIDPLSQACAISATSLKAADMAVYLINCLSIIQSSISAFDFAAARVETLTMHIDSHMDTLVTEETARFLRNCGIVEKLSILQHRTTQGPLSLEPGMDSRSLASAVRGFERSLSDLEAFIMPHCDKLMDNQLRATARSRVGDNIVNHFTALYEAVFDPSNKYDDPRAVIRYRPQQVKTIVDAL